MYDKNYQQDKAATQDNWSQISTAIYAQWFMISDTSQEDWCKTCYTLEHTTNSYPHGVHSQRGTTGKRAAYRKGPATTYNTKENTAQDNIASFYMSVSNAEGSTHNLSALNKTQEEPTSKPAKGSTRTTELNLIINILYDLKSFLDSLLACNTTRIRYGYLPPRSYHSNQKYPSLQTPGLLCLLQYPLVSATMEGTSTS